MRIRIVIPHYYAPVGEGHGSLGGDPQVRRDALRAAILALHEIAGGDQAMIEARGKRLRPTNNQSASRVEIIVVTSGDRHLLDMLDLPGASFHHHQTDAKPDQLGFECHALLARDLERIDVAGYLEDDLVIRDPGFFDKLGWFIGWAGEERILLPNRYELSPHPPVRKLYIDGALPAARTQAYRDLRDQADLVTRGLNKPLRFVPALNPHSGCFFLTAAQMRRWSAKPYFQDRDSGFIGPLESAASLGILRCFEPYKAAPECASFLEILHADNRYLDRRLQFGAAAGKGRPELVPSG